MINVSLDRGNFAKFLKAELDEAIQDYANTPCSYKHQKVLDLLETYRLLATTTKESIEVKLDDGK